MFIIAQRAALMLAAGGAAVTPSAPASAQANRDAVLNVLVECAKIDDPSARLACYDNNIGNAGAVARSTVPGQTTARGGAAPIAATEGATGFGRETIRTRTPSQAAEGTVQSIRPKVTAVSNRGSGLYLVTVEDGSVWEFVDGVELSYRPPRVGSVVEIDRGSLGSFLMRFDGQRPVQVRRSR